MYFKLKKGSHLLAGAYRLGSVLRLDITCHNLELLRRKSGLASGSASSAIVQSAEKGFTMD